MKRTIILLSLIIVIVSKSNTDNTKCHPECAWKCDDPKCPAICDPVCEPPRCHTSCQEPRNAVCDVKCEKPECEVNNITKLKPIIQIQNTYILQYIYIFSFID